MIRTFHPIGQGAFYSEVHEGFQMVYDCGEWKGNSRADAMIEASLHTGSFIDCLFISHFDYDHVSKIGLLSSKFPVRKAILPLLHESEAILLANIEEAVGHTSVAALIRNPQGFFGAETQIVQVTPTERNSPIENTDPIDIAGLRTGEISSGKILGVSSAGAWVFIPYNFKYASRHQKLVSLLTKAGLDIPSIVAADISYLVKKRKEIKEVYDSLDGRINQNSMFLYSGPVNDQIQTD